MDWRSLARNRALLAMSLGFFCWDYFWYFIISWLPSYLYNVRHVTLTRVAIFGALPYLIFAAGEGLGAWGAEALVRRGADLSRVTKGFIAAGFAIGVLVVPAALADSPAVSITFLMLAAFSGIACGNMLAVPRICAPDEEVALWTGVQNFAGNIGGVIAPAATGFAIAWTGSYVSSFLVVGVILIVGIVAYAVLLPSLTAAASSRACRAPL